MAQVLEAIELCLGYQPVKHQLRVRLTAQTAESFHVSQRMASHLRSLHKGRHTTQTEDRPKRGKPQAARRHLAYVGLPHQ
ncbi:hypothetical protein J2X88_005834 [Pseudomonas extremaustralis]|nr:MULTISPECIES: hypothetical protein [Pseudomonas]MDR6580922.1 hypothetical protein [Pseudomonas extremaustralis]